jgi:TPR repeat protein
VDKDERAAAKWMSMAAEQGDAVAQRSLGGFYSNGTGVDKDERAAAKWMSMAAEQGDARAQFILGVLYFHGIGVDKDQRAAAKWMRMAAEQGDADAQRSLGVKYSNGTGVDKDQRAAAKWTRMAAEQGDARAQCKLGHMLAAGQGVDQDTEEGVRWALKAAAQNRAVTLAGDFPEASSSLPRHYAKRQLELTSPGRSAPNVHVVGVAHRYGPSVRHVQEVIRAKKPGCVALELCEERTGLLVTWPPDGTTSANPTQVSEFSVAAVEAIDIGAKCEIIDRCITTTNARQAAASQSESGYPGCFMPLRVYCDDVLIDERDYVMAHRLYKLADDNQSTETGRT